MNGGGKNGRRPVAFSDNLVVLTEDLNADPATADGAPIDELTDPSRSTAQRGTSPTADEQDEDDGGGLEGEPLPLSTLQLLKLAAVYQPAWHLHEKLEAAYPRVRSKKGGRIRECLFAEVIVVLVATWLLPQASKRLVFKELRDPENWEKIVSAVASAYPDDPTRRLRDKPLTRRQFHTWRNVAASHSGYQELLKSFDNFAADISLDVGQFPAKAPITHPQTINSLTGDGKLVGALYKARIDQAVDLDTGEKLRSYDPEALQYTARYENRIDSDPDDPDNEPKRTWVRQAGYHIVHISSRSPVKGIRIPQSIRLLDQPNPDEPKGECSLAVDMALQTNKYITSKGGIVSAFAYDGGMYSEHRSQFLDNGIIPVGRIQRDKNDTYAERKLDPHDFKLRDGTKQAITITGTDGTPNIPSRLADGRKISIGLEQTKLQWNPQVERKILWGHWRVPDLPGVPAKLRKAKVLIQHNNTDTEIKNENLRTRALVPITENNPDFATLFGYRQDSESLNSDFERRLVCGRANAVTRNRFQLELNGYQHSCCIRALACHMIDNGIRKLPQWFGQHELPEYIFKSEQTDEP